MKSKKILLSSIVVLVIVAYVIYQRLGGFHRLFDFDDDDFVPKFPTSSQNPPITTEPQATNTNPNTQVSRQYKDGQYSGKNADTIFGKVQVAAVISGGKLTDVKFLQFPNDRPNSTKISDYSLPILKTEAIAAQSAKIDIISGATQTSEGFMISLASALAQAKL